MASLGENLRSFIINNANILTVLPTAASLGVVSQNHSEWDTTAPNDRIWFQRRSQEQDLSVGGTGLLTHTFFDLECISTDIDSAIDLADVVKSELHGYNGNLGAGYAGAIFVLDHEDGYEPHNLSEDDGCHVAALDVEVIWCE
jgi:hypothetical protein